MKLVKQYIAVRQAEFATHAFFRWLETSCDRFEVAGVLSKLAFWIASCPDVLAIAESRIADPQLAVLVRRRRKDAVRHAPWFFADLHALGGPTLAANDVFDVSHAPIRAAVHAVTSEVFRAVDDAQRVSLLLAVEAAGNVFLESMAEWAERNGPRGLRYFTQFEAIASEPHDIADSVELDDFARLAHRDLIDRTFDALAQIFDTLKTAVALRTHVRHAVAQ